MKETASADLRVKQLSIDEFGNRLATGIGLEIGPFAAFVIADPVWLREPLHLLYADYPVLAEDNVFSFHVKLETHRGFPRFNRKLVRFSVDGRVPHESMPADQALPVLEWGINLVIAMRSHAYLMLHSAVVEFDGGALLLPAEPGFGKTTLCAGLSLHGWRLFSDEFGLVRPRTEELIPIPRPLALKNESISVLRDYSQSAIIGPETPNTRKGTVAHLRPPGCSVREAARGAPARWVVFPEWRRSGPCVLEKMPRSEAFMMLASNAFNYELLGEDGFHTVASIVKHAQCFKLSYSNLEEAVERLTRLASRDAA